MYLPLIQYVVHTERQSHNLQQCMLNAIERDCGQNKTSRKVFEWLGTRMIAWGTKLQGSPNIDTGCQETTFNVSVTVH